MHIYRYILAVILTLITSQAFAAASLVPAFGTVTDGTNTASSGQQGTNTLKIVGGVVTHPGSQPTVTITPASIGAISPSGGNTFAGFQNFSGGMKASDVVAKGPEIDVRYTGFAGGAHSTNEPGYSTFDSTAALQAAATYAGAVRGNLILPDALLISGTVYVPIGVGIVHKGGVCKITMSSTGTFNGGWAFIVNSTDGTNWTVSYPNMRAGKISNIEFRNDSQTANRRGILYFGSADVENIRGYYMSQLIKRPSGVYSDNFHASRIYSEPVMGADYQVELAGLGDGAVVEGCHFPWNVNNPGDGVPNGVKITSTFGGRISDCIGGNVMLGNATVTVQNGHYEQSQIELDGANVELKSNFFGANSKIPVVMFNAYNGSYQVHTLLLDNNEFAYMDGVLMWQGADVQLDTGYTVSISNCYRRYMVSSSVDKSQIAGLNVVKNDGTSLDSFNDYSYFLSRSSRIEPNYLIGSHYGISPTSNSFYGFSAVSADSGVSWGIASGTYYYHSQLLVDRNKLIGRTGNNGEFNIVLTASGAGSRINMSYGNHSNIGILRLYRGTSSGSYDHYVDIPVENTVRLYDNGSSINGFAWVARTPGVVTTLNSIGESDYRIEGSNVWVRAAAAPSVGTWQNGDVIDRAAPSAGQNKGWICTAGGSPGTWKQYGGTVLTGAGAPSTTPAFLGADYLDTTNNIWYKAKGSTSSTDWIAVDLHGITGSIGGGALLAGACTSGTATVTGATTAMTAAASPVTYPGDGTYWLAYVSASNTVTVKVCGTVAITPVASAYNVRVLQ